MKPPAAGTAPKQPAARIDPGEVDNLLGLEPWTAAVKLSANRGAEEPGRIERLKEVLAYLGPKTPSWQSGLLIGLHDHKGTLTATWSRQPTPREQAAVLDACGEQGEWEIEHAVDDER